MIKHKQNMALEDRQKILDALIELGNSFEADMERLEKERNEFIKAELTGKNVPLIITIKDDKKSKNYDDLEVWFHPCLEEKLILKFESENVETYISSFFLSSHNEESVKMVIAVLTKIHEAHYTSKGMHIELQEEIKQELLAIPHMKETIRYCFDDNVISFTIGAKSISTLADKGTTERPKTALESDRVQFTHLVFRVIEAARERRNKKKKDKCSYKCLIS